MSHRALNFPFILVVVAQYKKITCKINPNKTKEITRGMNEALAVEVRIGCTCVDNLESVQFMNDYPVTKDYFENKK